MARGRHMRGGDGEFLGNVVAAGVGAYAAQNATSWGDLAWRLAKVVLIILGVFIVIGIVARLFGKKKEKFVPTPSPEQDKKHVTPAGNVITY